MAREFDGVDEWLNYGAAVVSGTPFTLAAYFISTDATIDQTILGVQTNGSINNSFRIRFRGSVTNDPVVAVARVTTNAESSLTGYTIGAWAHIAGVFTSDISRKVYLDGIAGTENTTSSIPSGMDQTRIGASGDGTGDTIGRIAEVGIWNVALTDDEVLALARGKLPKEVRPEALAGYWPIFGNDDPEPDLSPAIVTATRYNMTLSGTPAKANHAPVTLWTPKWWSVPLIEVAAGGASVPAIMHHRRMQG